MTTNVFCKAGATLATDSRWSVTIPGYAVIYVDDTRFEKIVMDGPLAYMFAGDSGRINAWKAWIGSPNKVVMARPSVEGRGMALCIVDMEKCEVVFESNQEITFPEARFAGTGALAAHGCWSKNKDARKSVETAKIADRFSGGTVRFVDMKSKAHNLQVPDDFDSVRADINTRGMVMYFQNPQHVSLKSAAQNDPLVADAAKKLASGEITLTAPSAAAENEWSEEAVKRLDQVLGQYYPAK